MAPYIADVDGLAGLATRTCVVGKRVGRIRLSTSRSTGTGTTTVATTAATTVAAASSSITATATEASTEATTTAKSSTAAEASAKSTTESSTTTAEAAGSRASETVFADFEVTTLPVIAVELCDSVASVFDSIKGNNARALRTTVRSHVDIGAYDRTCDSYEMNVSVE